MANHEHLDILMQGVEVWNQWRSAHSTVQSDLSGANLNAGFSGDNLFNAIFLRAYSGDKIITAVDINKALTGVDLSEADLSGADLNGIKFWNANLRKTDFLRANLTRATLSGADLSGALLGGADLTEADLSEALLVGANLSGADLSGALLVSADLTKANLTEATLGSANFTGATLSGADLTKANLTEAMLGSANFTGATLSGADLTRVHLSYTIFAWNDFRSIRGLETAIYRGPSTLDIKSVQLPEGEVLRHFLQGMGFPDQLINSLSLLNSSIQYYSCFISYSSKDQDFAERIYADLQSKGVRCWFAPHDMHIGDKIRQRIDESIRLHDKLLLVLSEASVTSDWVEHEVEMALAKEHKEKRTVLFPVRLDMAILEREYDGWPALVRQERHIGDFTRWEEHNSYQISFDRLLRDLKADAQL
jgi:uncharacterized protein YjbI with pentapeptide repeats